MLMGKITNTSKTLLSTIIATTLILLSLPACRSLYLTFTEPLEIMGFETVIATDTVWESKKGPYSITGNVFILPEATLTIAPGTRIELLPGVLIKSQGCIVAKGTQDQPIHITGAGESPWERIECFGGRFEKSGRVPANIFHHCVIEGGGGITIRAGAADIRNCEFRNNLAEPLRIEFSAAEITDNEMHHNSSEREAASGNGAGIMVYTDKQVRIANNYVHHNISAGGRDGGGGIYAYAYDTGEVSVFSNRVAYNSSDRHGGGIVAYSCHVRDNRVSSNTASDSGGGIFAIRSELTGNTVRDNAARRGGGIYTEEGVLRGNLIAANTAHPGMGGGLFYYGNEAIIENTLVGNGAPDGDAGDTIVVSGSPAIRSNNIIAETGYALRVQTHRLAVDLMAAGNYWGTDNPDIIGELIYDWLDDSQIGLVDSRAYKDRWIQAAPRSPTAWSMRESAANVPQDHLQGRINQDRVLGGLKNNAYTIDQNILIPESVAVTIKPGTRLSMETDVTVRIRGKLFAEGAPEDRVVFTGDAKRPWGRLLFENRSSQLAAETGTGEPIPNGSGRLSYCVIENGRGIAMDGTGPLIEHCIVRGHQASGIRIRDAGVTISRSRIENNHSRSSGGGIYSTGSCLVYIEENQITNNYAAEDGGGVFAYGQRSNTAANLIGNDIHGNRCRGDGGGVWASRTSLADNRIIENRAGGKGGGLFSTFALVENNRIAKNQAGSGGGVFAETNSSLTGNIIMANACDSHAGGGVYLNFWGMSIKNEVFAENTIMRNTAEGASAVGGIYLNGAMIFTQNNIFNNKGLQLYNANASSEDPLNAEECYWGTNKETEIKSGIYDGSDDPSLAPVSFKPFAGEPIEIRAAK